MGEMGKKTKAKRVNIYDTYLIAWVICLKQLQCFSDGLAASDQLWREYFAALGCSVPEQSTCFQEFYSSAAVSPTLLFRWSLVLQPSLFKWWGLILRLIWGWCRALTVVCMLLVFQFKKEYLNKLAKLPSSADLEHLKFEAASDLSRQFFSWLVISSGL